MKIPESMVSHFTLSNIGWDSYKTLMLFDFFREKPNEK
jgi:hypothetical protein